MNFLIKIINIGIIMILFLSLTNCNSNSKKPDLIPAKQLTFSPKNHSLDNNDNFSFDDKWIVYDTRGENGIGGNSTIEKVCIESGIEKIIYQTENQTKYGPGVGAASFNHHENKVIFIHGLDNCNKDNPYKQWRRFGMIIDEDNSGKKIIMDSRNIRFPFTPGALRGGSHRHEWSYDGKWVGFTYNDEILQQLEEKTGKIYNLRTIAVSKFGERVNVKQEDAENFGSDCFTAVVVKVVADPKPNSDEICHAAGDTWIGKKGYQKADGQWQRGRAFLGKIKTSDNKLIEEVYIVDIPEEINIVGKDGPLEGTLEKMPAPPAGCKQKRMTFTEKNPHQGVRFVRASHDGSKLAFLAYDKNNIVQLYMMPTIGGKVSQLTNHTQSIQNSGNLRWHPNDKQIVYICNKSIYIYDFKNNQSKQISKKFEDTPDSLVWSHDGNTIIFNMHVISDKQKYKQIFVLKLS